MAAPWPVTKGGKTIYEKYLIVKSQKVKRTCVQFQTGNILKAECHQALQVIRRQESEVGNMYPYQRAVPKGMEETQKSP